MPILFHSSQSCLHIRTMWRTSEKILMPRPTSKDSDSVNLGLAQLPISFKTPTHHHQSNQPCRYNKQTINFIHQPLHAIIQMMLWVCVLTYTHMHTPPQPPQMQFNYLLSLKSSPTSFVNHSLMTAINTDLPFL